MTKPSAYAQAGVDYRLLQAFKDQIVAVGRQTHTFPNQLGVYVDEDGCHQYKRGLPHLWKKVTEGLGNKNWIAEWLYQFDSTGLTRYQGIVYDNVMMAVGDVISFGALPVIYTDEVTAGDSDWFLDQKRNRDFCDGMLRACLDCHMALVQGETPSLRYLVRATDPVISAPVLSGCVTGIISPAQRKIRRQRLQAGDSIIGISSSGIHANGISLVIKEALKLPDGFLTKLPTGRNLGEETLLVTRNYLGAVEALLTDEIDIHALLPGTGDGVGKLAQDKRPFTYRVHSWPNEIPALFLFMRELGIDIQDLLTTFNWGIGYYVFVPRPEVNQTIDTLLRAGYEAMEVGLVEEGERMTIFEPEGGLHLPPPGE